MDYYAIIGMVVAAMILVFGAMSTQKKSTKEEVKEIEQLNYNIIKLNSSIEHMIELDRVRDNRITKHGLELDEVKKQQTQNELTLQDHESRLKGLEKTADTRRT